MRQSAGIIFTSFAACAKVRSTMSSPQPAVNFDALPLSAADMLDWTWEQYAPYAAALEATELNTENVEQWLRDWSKLSDYVSEQGTRLRNRSSADTRVVENLKALEAFQAGILPPATIANQNLKQKLLASGLCPAGMELSLHKMRAEAERYREENVPLFTTEQLLCNDYNRITGAMTVDFDGREITVAEIKPILMEPERERREAAWRAGSERFEQDRSALNETWARLVDLRTQIARNADCETYTEYIWPLKQRFDYTPQDCEVFQQAVAQVVVPALARRFAKAAERLGLDRFRPWDVYADPLERQALRPFGDAAVLEEKCSGIFAQLDAGLGRQFEQMRAGYLDLPNRPGKAPGGWCSDYPVVKRPHIFMNTVGMHDDVQTLFHEAGHAFHGFATYNLPYGQQRHAYMEFCEVASMAMELLAAPYLTLERGGFYTPAEAARARTEHFDRMLYIWVMVAAGDAFQHWIYANPKQSRDAAEASRVFGELQARYFPGIDFSGLERYRDYAWQRTLHYYLVPHYYIEYGIAQLGATQVWQNSVRDAAGALTKYKAALALGGTVSLPELFSTAGAHFAFDTDTFAAAIGAIEREVEELEKVAAA
jgi:oligoendopeptidase F